MGNRALFESVLFCVALTSSIVLVDARLNSTVKSSTTKACGVSKSMIVMSRGRSGSSVICDIINRQFGYRYKSLRPDGEILGNGWQQMETLSDPLSLVRNKTCQLGSKTGFYMKWKPDYWSSEYIDLLRWVANQSIPVVYNVRNPLDVHLSELKHRNNRVAPRCRPSNQKCLEMHHKNQLVRVDVPSLVEALTYATSPFSMDDDNVKALLNREKVNYYPVQYEVLESDDNATRLSAWRRVFEFLSPSRDWSNLTVEDTMSDAMVRTSSISQVDKIENYDEVRNALRGTRFDLLLH